MLISRIYSLDATSAEFANSHAAGQLARSSGAHAGALSRGASSSDDFASYLARTMSARSGGEPQAGRTFQPNENTSYASRSRPGHAGPTSRPTHGSDEASARAHRNERQVSSARTREDGERAARRAREADQARSDAARESSAREDASREAAAKEKAARRSEESRQAAHEKASKEAAGREVKAARSHESGEESRREKAAGSSGARQADASAEQADANARAAAAAKTAIAPGSDPSGAGAEKLAASRAVPAGDLPEGNGRGADGTKRSATRVADVRAAGESISQKANEAARGVSRSETKPPAQVTVSRRSEKQVEIDVELARAADDTSAGEKPVRTPLEGAAGSLREEGADGASKLAASREGETSRSGREQRGDGSQRRGAETAQRIEVRDLRSASGSRGDASGQQGERGPGEHTPSGSLLSQSRSQSSSDPATDAASQFEAMRTDSLQSGSQGRTAQTGQRPPAQSTASLRQALRDQVNGEIVRSARLIVRGQDQGEIRLNLRPEQMGSVRISLQMQDGHIAGRIIVDNQSVRDVFEQNLSALQKAFAESGLEASGLEVSVADSGNESGTRDETARSAGRGNDPAGAFSSLVPDADVIEDDHDLIDLVV